MYIALLQKKAIASLLFSVERSTKIKLSFSPFEERKKVGLDRDRMNT